jgi:hypothetical protein
MTDKGKTVPGRNQYNNHFIVGVEELQIDNQQQKSKMLK